MATQQIEFSAATGLTLTATLHAAGSDAIAYTASAVVEQTNRKGVYRATFAGIAAGTYQLVAFSGSTPVAVWWGFAQDTASTFVFGERMGEAGAVRAELTTELARIDVATSTRLATASYTAPDNATISTINTNVNTLLSRVTETLFSGITSLGKWLGAIAGKTADAATRAEINATTAGATYNETTDSLQAQKDTESGTGTVVDANIVSANGLPVLTGQFNFAVSAGGRMINNVLDIVPGDEYIAADNTAVSFTDSKFPNLSLFDSAELTVSVAGVAVVDHVSTTELDNSSKTVSVELTEAQTTLLADYVGEDAFFDLELVRADATKKTVARGPVNILDPLG
jgi:hypothetical protein